MKTGNSKSMFSKLPIPEKRIFWIIVLLIIKFSLLAFLVKQHRPTTLPETIAVCSGDCDSYLTPIDNLVENGSYQPDVRLPGYGFPYFIFSLFFKKNIAVSLLIIFQTFIDAIATFVLAMTMYSITQKKSAFYLTLFLYGIGVSVSCYNNWILTESLTSSVLIFGFHFLVRYFKEPRKVSIILSGIFFTWAYFLRPVNFPLIFIVPLLLLIAKQFRLKHAFLFLIPALIVNSAWTIRNYNLTNKVFILSEKKFLSIYEEYDIACWDFCKTFSDFKVTSGFFDRQGLTYFGQYLKGMKPEDVTLPDEIYTEDFTLDSLVKLRNYTDEIHDSKTSPERQEYLKSLLVEKYHLYAESVREHHPFLVYVKTPVVLLRNFTMQSGVHNLFFTPFSYLSLPGKFFKLFFICIYWLSFISFLLSLIYARTIINNKMLLVAYAIAFYLILIHPVLLRSIEARYIIPSYPFIVAGAVFFLSKLILRFNKTSHA